MATPIAFPSTTSNLSLPLLFSGQAQKEFFLNQALSIIDALLLACVVETRAAPPAAPLEASCYLVGGTPTGEWMGHDDELAVHIGGAWQFILPKDGLKVFDQNAGAVLLYRSGWQVAIEPALPSGGSTVDSEARGVIAQLIAELRKVGVFQDQS